MTEFDTPPGRVFVAGLSAGAAMAVIPGQTYPDVFAAIGLHSGLPYGAATDVPSAFAAMARNEVPGAPVSKSATVPAIVLHGTVDATVHRSNTDGIARQVCDRAATGTLQHDTRETLSGRDVRRTIATTPTGDVVLEDWRIDGLGHARSGGQTTGSYTDLKGPDASAEMVHFFFDTPANGV